MRTNWPNERIDQQLAVLNPEDEDQIAGSARTARAKALLASLVATNPSADVQPMTRSTPRQLLARPGHGRGLVIVGITAIVAVMLVVVVVKGTGAGPRSSALPGTSHLPWRLVSDDGPPVTFASTRADSGQIRSLTCPTSTVCYAVLDGGIKGGTVVKDGVEGGTYLPPTAYASTNGGDTWQQLALPVGVSLTTSFTCPSATDCMVGASEPAPTASSAGDAAPQVVLSTNDGGSTWMTHAVPLGANITGADPSLAATITGTTGLLDQLICLSAETCLGFGTVPTDQDEQPVTARPQLAASQTVFVRTDDGGASWTRYVFPWIANPDGSAGWSNVEHATFSCPSATSCIGVARVLSGPSGDGVQTPSLFTWRTSDGGATWTHDWISGMEGEQSDVACPSADECLASVNKGSLGSTTGLEHGVLVTSDGGATWTFHQLAAGASSSLEAMSCLTVQDCWAGGYVGGSTPGAIFATFDGGGTWSPVVLPPNTADIGAIDCEASCVAVAYPNDPTVRAGIWTVPSQVLSNG